MRTHALIGLVALSACGGSSTTIVCSNGTVTGALMGTFNACNDFDARYRANLDTFQLTAAYTELPTSFTWSTSWEIKGAPSAKTYSMTMLMPPTATITMKKGTPTWLARTGGGVAAAGNGTLTFTDITENTADGNVTTYKLLKGTIVGQLEASPGTMSTGAINVTMDFCQGTTTDCPPPMTMP